MYRSSFSHRGGSDHARNKKTTNTSRTKRDDSPDPDRKKFSSLSAAVLLRFGRTLGVVDVIFLGLVVVGIWRMIFAKGDDDPTVSLKRDFHRLQRAMDSSKVSSMSGTVLFRGTRACNERSMRNGPQQEPQQALEQDNSSSSSVAEGKCQIHFPLDIATTRTNCKSEYCVRTSHRCGGDSSSSGSGDAASCHRNRHHHAALLRPLLFDGTEKDHSNNATGQLIVLSDGVNYSGHALAEIVVLRLPVLVLDPFRNYAKAHTKIKSKILLHAFSAMDSFLYNEKQSLWYYGGASTLVILQYGTSLYFASTGNAIGFLAQWNDKANDGRGGADIIHRAAVHHPETPVENKRIHDAGGIVRNDTISGEPKVFIPKDSYDKGIMTSRALGAGRWKYRGVIAVPTVEEVNLLNITSDLREARDNRLFVVAASKGVVQSQSEQSIADKLGEALFSSSVELDNEIKRILQDAGSTPTTHNNKPGNIQDPQDLTLLASTIAVT